MKFFLNIR